jgi:hypothetical protein
LDKTPGDDVIQSFESSFQDKIELPESLEKLWLKKAIARYSVELDPLTYDPDFDEFSDALDQYAIDTLASYMKQYYMEREVSKVNKRVSIVGKDLSYDGTGNAKKYASQELTYSEHISYEMTDNQKTPAYN